MGHLMEQFKHETGNTAMYRKGGADYHTLRYVKWLEAKVEKFTSTNSKSAQLIAGRDVPEQYKQSIDDMTATLAHYGDMVWGLITELGCDRFECKGRSVTVKVTAKIKEEKLNGVQHTQTAMPRWSEFIGWWMTQNMADPRDVYDWFKRHSSRDF